ncbi:MAG: hypothetical protein QM770_23045 [Tepidisphaeraceae bacterium]
MAMTYVIEQAFMAQVSWLYSYQTLTNVICGALALWALFVRFSRGDPVFTNRPRELVVTVVLYAYCFVSTLWSTWDGATGFYVNYLPILLAFGFIGPMAVLTLSDFKAVLWSLFLAGFVIIPLLLLSSEWHGRFLVMKQGAAIGSVIGETGNPLAVASYAGWCAVGAALIRFRHFAWFLEIPRWAFVAMAVALCLSTASRGQAFALAVSVIVFIPFSLRINRMSSIFALVATLIVLAVIGNELFASAYEADQERWNSGTFWGDFAEGRVGTGLVLLNYWANAGPFAWLFGLGNNASFALPGVWFYVHVVMMEVLGEEGLVGFILLWLVPIFFGRSFYDLYVRYAHDKVSRGVLCALGGIFLFEVIISFKQGSMLGSETAFAWAIMLGRIHWTVMREERAYEQMDDAYYDQLAEEDAAEAEGELAPVG